jgi:hypothetical protein
MVDFNKALREYRAQQSQEDRMPKTTDNTEQPKTGELIPSNYNALSVPAEKIVAFLRENVGTQGLKPFDLDKIKVPGGGAVSFELQTLEGPKPFQVVEGIIMHFRDVRSYWKEKYGSGAGNVPPDCSSEDGLVGVGKPGGDCQTCPLAQFGTAVNEKGEPAAGQACRQIRLMLLLRQESMVPMLVVIPPSSSKNARQYFLRLISNGYNYYGVTTQLRLEKAKSAGNVVYSQATFAMGRKLEAHELERVQLIAIAMKEMFAKVTVVHADVTA